MARIISKEDINSVIAEEDANTLVKEAERLGKELVDDGLSKSQIRGVFGMVRQIQASWGRAAEIEETHYLRRVLLLKPRLAYQSARDSKVGPLATVLQDSIDSVVAGKSAEERRNRFTCLADLFEAILAYHTKYEEEKKKRGRGRS